MKHHSQKAGPLRDLLFWRIQISVSWFNAAIARPGQSVGLVFFHCLNAKARFAFSEPPGLEIAVVN